MKLTIITEAIQGLQTASEKLDIPIEQLDKLLTDADPTGRKYKNYILKLLLKQAIRLPEDNHRVKETLANFTKYQHNLQVKDILKYNSLHELETALEPYFDSISKRKGGNNLNPLSLPGVELVKSDGEYKVYKVSNIESLKDIGEGSKWCTRRSYPDCQAEHYIDEYGWIGVVYKDNKPFIQYTSDYSQIMDVNDEPFNTPLFEFIPAPSLDSDVKFLYSYALNVVKNRWLEAEPEIFKNPVFTFKYVRYIIGKRYYEVEPIILQDPDAAYLYALHIIKDRWPEAESIISQEPNSAYYYAKDIIKGQWPDGEDAISNSARYAYLYAYMLGERWPKGEPVIMQDPEYAVKYAEFVIKDKWPEAEPFIIKDHRRRLQYNIFLYSKKKKSI